MIENGSSSNIEDKDKEIDIDEKENLDKSTTENKLNVNRFDKSKLTQSTEIKLNLTNSLNSNIHIEATPVQVPNNNTINPLSILQEINADIDSLSQLLSINLQSVPNQVKDPFMLNKSIQVKNEIVIPVSKENKSVQISDKDEYFTNLKESTEKVNQLSQLERNVDKRINQSEVLYPSFRVKPMEEITTRIEKKHKPIIYNQKDNVMHNNLNYNDLLHSTTLRHSDIKKSKKKYFNERYNNSVTYKKGKIKDKG